MATRRSKRARAQEPPSSSPSAMETDEEAEAYDPMAFYREQQRLQLLQASQHVQASQEEIQRAQSIARRSDSSQDEEEPQSEGDGRTRRRSRAAAAQAKQALSLMTEDEENPNAAPVSSNLNATAMASPRGRGRGRGRGRPPGTTAAVMARRRAMNAELGLNETVRRVGRPRKAVNAAEPEPEDESSLYFIIRNGKASLQSVVDDWIAAYKVDEQGSLLSLMQFFVSASGCKGKITPAMQQLQHDEIIRTMTEEFDEESGEYPLVTPGQYWKKFRTSYCDFIHLLVEQCKQSIIYDQNLMDHVISLLTQLSDSQVRAFRHTATLGAMKLMTALVEVALGVSIDLERAQRQYNSEQQSSRSSERLESLMSRRKELEENTEEIKNMLTYMFKSVFVHRYRDIVPEIRAICMYEIGQWMMKYPNYFLDDSYLKYIGWTIHDKVGDVRLKCLQSLQPLYAKEELKDKLELFTSKFKDRIVQMTLDKDFDVAVEAVKLVISISRYHRDMLTDKDCESIYELVHSSHRAVAQAAGEFLNERIFTGIDIDPDLRTRRGKKRLPNTPMIRDLVQFVIEADLHEHGAYIVDSLIESNAMLKDWECMTDLLLEEHGPREEPLDERQETTLIEIMVCAIKQASSGEPPIGRGSTRKVLSAKEQKLVQDDRQSLTAHFIQTLPPLLRQYMPNAQIVSNLLCIPQHFELEIYTTSRQEKNLDSLLSLIQEIVDRHSDKQVLEACSVTMDHLCKDKYAIFSRCDIARSRLLDMVCSNYLEVVDEYMNLLQGDLEPTEDEMFKLVSAIKKVESFSICHNLAHWNIWEKLFELVTIFRRSIAEKEDILIPVEAVKLAMNSCHYGLIWDQYQVENTTERNSTAQDVVALRARLDRFVAELKEIMSVEEDLIIKDAAFMSLSDLLIFFKTSSSRSADLDPLFFKPDASMEHMMNYFVQTKVFVDKEDETMDDHAKIEELHKRRNLLTCFCKLVVYNVFRAKIAADIFKHYVTFYNDYGDIIKTTLGKARDSNKVNCAKIMVEALRLKFKEVQQLQDTSIINRQTVEFHSVKELAKRFALSFGLDALKNRDAVTTLHREGILLAVTPKENPDDPAAPPPNLAMLEILSEFTNKLLKQDRKAVLEYLDKRIADSVPSSCGEDWQPLMIYRNSLVQGEDIPIAVSKRPYARKRKAGEDDDDDDEDDE